MILDKINKLANYAPLHPLFEKVVNFLESHDLSAMPLGHHPIEGDDLYVNIVETQPKSSDEAMVETHQKMIDIQIPISGPETHGYISLMDLKPAQYNESDDISFYSHKPVNYFKLSPGEFVIYFPQDGHAPAITPHVLRKAIFKVKY